MTTLYVNEWNRSSPFWQLDKTQSLSRFVPLLAHLIVIRNTYVALCVRYPSLNYQTIIYPSLMIFKYDCDVDLEDDNRVGDYLII